MRIVLIAALALTSVPALSAPGAVEKRYSKDYDRCLSTGDAADGVQPAMTDCTAQEYGRQDARLNQAWVMVMRRLGPAKKASLRTSQRAWLKTRDRKCLAERDSYQGGSIAPMMFYNCMTNETIKRTLWLEQYR